MLHLRAFYPLSKPTKRTKIWYFCHFFVVCEKKYIRKNLKLVIFQNCLSRPCRFPLVSTSPNQTSSYLIVALGSQASLFCPATAQQQQWDSEATSQGFSSVLCRLRSTRCSGWMWNKNSSYIGTCHRRWSWPVLAQVVPFPNGSHLAELHSLMPPRHTATYKTQSCGLLPSWIIIIRKIRPEEVSTGPD